MKAICTALLLALAFWLGTRYTLTPRPTAPASSSARASQPVKASVKPSKRPKPTPKPAPQAEELEGDPYIEQPTTVQL